MPAYVVRRVLWLGVVLFGMATITFVIMHAVPGGPWDYEKPLSPAVVAKLNARYGLDKSLWEQYRSYMWGALHGDLGVSFVYQDRPVTQIIGSGLKVTATLGGLAFAISWLVGLPMGLVAALRQNTWIDYASVFFATSFASLPGFVLGIFLIMLFSVTLHLLPTSGWHDWRSPLMPAIALGAPAAAYAARLTRASVLEVMRQDYVRTGRSKGLAPITIQTVYVLRNSLIPILTVAGVELAVLVSGSFIVESLFSIPGIGRLFVQGVFQRDYGLIMGSVLFYSFVIAVLNLAVDLLYAVVDPRIRYRA